MDRRNFGSSICTQAAPSPFSSRSVAGDVVAPAPVPQLHRDRAVRQRLDQPRQVIVRGGVSFLKLAGNCASRTPSLPASCRGGDGLAEPVDVPAFDLHVTAAGGGGEHLRMGELLVQLDREREVVGRPVGPGRSDRAARHA